MWSNSTKRTADSQDEVDAVQHEVEDGKKSKKKKKKKKQDEDEVYEDPEFNVSHSILSM
jgi:hypothetical protein